MVAHKMVFVANMTLKMGSGKLAAQVGHACLGLYRKISKTVEVIFRIILTNLVIMVFRVNVHLKLGDDMVK